ncbi:uncharacterized protein LOC109863012 [Pseudomyrmex gracilis]|uniref:uncharacterized protein LOC109863012 n=1 Tax=Pseudomyrmex gracilis TaxID=219809 RepID=UPI0009953DC2|nr:uncharacterized protein LOC109863012 [Pseudomyrmex gracilis]
MASRVVRAYKTAALEAVRVLARVPPANLLARQQIDRFLRFREYRNEGVDITSNRTLLVNQQVERALVRRWRERLLAPGGSGLRVREAVDPVLNRWLGRAHGELTFYLTQILTGHGSFGDYLFRIRKADTPACPHCPSAENSAQHTLEECPAWAQERAAVRAHSGDNLSLSAVVSAMLRDAGCWRAIVAFCGTVKEDAELARQGQPASRRRRRSPRLAGDNESE